MEAAGLYQVAVENNAKAIAVMTVTDHILKDQQLTPEQRQTTLKQMITLTLDAAITL